MLISRRATEVGLRVEHVPAPLNSRIVSLNTLGGNPSNVELSFRKYGLFNGLLHKLNMSGNSTGKQHLRIQAFLGTSENAVKTQI